MKNIENPALTDADYLRDPSLRQFPSTEFGRDHARALQLARMLQEAAGRGKPNGMPLALAELVKILEGYQHD